MACSKTSILPCNGCRICCQGDMIILHPDLGDDPSIYKTVPTENPLTGEQTLMLDHKANGDCIYLGPNGCENYENRPLICREYDCRIQFLSFTKADRRKLVNNGMAHQGQFDAGKARAHTLSADKRRMAIDMRNQRGSAV